MAKITSHVLNGLHGTHAGDVLVCLKNGDTGKTVLEGKTDVGGRLALDVATGIVDPGQRCQLIFETGRYWAEQDVKGEHVIPQIALLFDMPEPSGQVHMPLIVSPHSYSTWKSS